MNVTDPDRLRTGSAAINRGRGMARDTDPPSPVQRRGYRSAVRRPGRSWRIAAIPLALVAVAMTSVVAASASSDGHALLALMARSAARAVGVALPEAGGPVTYPPSDFTALEPSYVPRGLDLRSITYIPGRTSQGGQQPDATLSRGGPATAPSAVAASRLRELSRAGTAVLYSRFSSNSGSGYVEVIEHRVGSDSAQPEGPAVAVGSLTGHLLVDGDGALLTFEQAATAVEIETNLGPAEAIRVGASLRGH